MVVSTIRGSKELIPQILCIPDAHAQHGVSNERFTILGRYIAHRMPDVIVCIGDWVNMDSLSQFDKGKRKSYGQTYDQDIKSAIDAQEKMFKEIHLLNIRRKQEGLPEYKPKWYMLGGNHDEARIYRAVNEDPKLYGTLKMSDLRFKEFGWKYIPFLTPLKLENVSFCHYFPVPHNPKMAINSVEKYTHGGYSKVAGHSHMLRVHYSGQDRPKWGLQIGCWLDPKQITGEFMDYEPAANRQLWWVGLTLLQEVKNGSFSPIFVPYEYLARKFGKNYKYPITKAKKLPGKVKSTRKIAASRQVKRKKSR